MQLLAFFAARGYPPDVLASLSAREKLFLRAARELYYEDLSAVFGGGDAR